MNKHQRVLEAIFEKRANIAWSDIESMLLYYGAEISDGRGSRVRIALNGVRAVFHRPHPQKETDRGAVASMQRFLREAGIGKEGQIVTYKGYQARVELDEEAGMLHGEVINTRDVITFQASSVEELKRAFEDSVDDYLEFCASRGEDPEKPFSGKFVVRVPPEVHRQIMTEARLQGKSLNAYVLEKLRSQAGLPAPHCPNPSSSRKRPKLT